MIRKALSVLFILAVVTGGSAFGKFFGSWENTLSFQTQDPLISLAESSSALKASYFAGEVADLPNRFLSALFITDKELSNTGFGLQGIFVPALVPLDRRSIASLSVYSKQDIVIDWPIGTWSVISDLVFSVPTAAMRYWWNQLNVTAYGTAITATFAVVALGGEYRNGLELKVVGSTIYGLGLDVTTSFGIDTDFDQLMAVQTGSGKCGVIPYTGAEVNLTGLSLGCVYFETTAVFSADFGFDYIQFEFEIAPEAWPVEFDATLTFMLQTKSIVLVPTLDLENVCLDVYMILDPRELSPGSSTTEALLLQGLGLRDAEIDSATLSGLVSFGGGLYKRLGSSDIELRANDYLVDISALDPKQQQRYSRTDYDLICSIQKSIVNFDFAADVYFGTNGAGQLFGLGLITLETNYVLSSEIEFGLGLAVDLATGWHKLVLNFDYSLFVY